MLVIEQNQHKKLSWQLSRHIRHCLNGQIVWETDLCLPKSCRGIGKMKPESKFENIMIGYLLPFLCSGLVVGIVFLLVRGLARAGG